MTCLYPRRILVPAMFFIALASLFLTVDTVPAAVVWDGGSLVDSSLVTPENWVGDSLPLTTDDVQFDGSVRLDPFTSGAVTYNSLAFNATAGAFTIGGTDTISLTATSSTLVNNSELLQTLSAPVSFAAKAYVRATAGDLDLGNVTLGTSTLSFYGKNHTTTVNGTITGTTGVTATDGTTLVLDANSAATWTNGALTLDNTSNSTTPTVVRLTASGAAGAASSSTSNYIMINGASDKSATLELSGGITIDKWIRCQHRTGAMADVAHIRNIGDNTLQGRIYNRTGGAYVNIDSDSGLLTIASAIEQPESGARSIRFRGEGDIKLTGTLTGVGTAGQSWKVSKIGSGTLTYDSAGINYLGNTGVFGGTLTLTSTGANALANSPVIWIDSGASLNVSAAGLTLSGTQTLQGHGTVTGNLATSSGSTLIPGGTADDGLSTFTDTPGTLSVSGNLTLASGAVMPWDLSDVIDNVNNGINDRIDVGGNLALDGGTINVNLLSGALAEGDYRLFNAGTISGTVGNLTLNVEGGADTRINTTLTQNLQEVNLHVVGTPLELTWQGNSTNNNWDLHTTADWDGGEMFYNLDSVTFNDTGSNSPDINLVGDLCPANITVEETKDYVFAGSGSLEGNIAVTKTGTGKLTLANTGLNEFTGTVALSGGTLAVNRVDDWTLAASLAGTATLEQAGAGTLRLSGSNSGFTGPVVISGGTLSLDAAADMDLSAGMPDITDNANLQLGGTSNFTVGRKITGTGGLEKVDANIVYLTADNDYQGATTITGGTLQVGTSATRTGTPGSGAIVNNGLLILNSDQVYEIAGDISGSGGLRFGFDAANSQLPNAAVTLSGDNSFDGAVNIYQGTVIATSSTAFGSTVGSTRVISQNSQQDNGRLELDGSGGNLEIAESFTTTGSGGTAFRYDGPGIIRNVAGDNKITGSIGMTGGGGSSLVKVAAGTLELAGAISNAYNNSLRYIVLGGESGTGGTVSGSITDGSTNAYTGVKKVDSNTWTFTGNNSYTGPTCIYGGTLALGEVPDGYGGVLSTGSIASSPAVILYNDSATLQVTGLTNPTFTVPSTMWLVGNGTVAGNVESSYGTISPSGPVNPSAGVTTDTNLPIGTLNVGGNLKLSGYDYLQFKLGGTGGTQIDQIQVTNTLQTDEYFSSPSYVSIVPSGPVTPGTYTLISAASQSGLGTFELDPYHPHNTRYGLTLDNATAGQVKVTVTGSNDTMVWSGPSGGTWDVVTSANWTGPTDYLFWQGDAVQFTGETEDMEIVVGDAYYNSVLYPASILVSSSKNYTFSGDGKISSGASL
ncbi:MAG: autotransporter-associated beta strand repeat-containing protein, partial [Pirellulales bacterium]|nr:autotransporter-associated beta strand repeat-containing protein [Pirellulales bacterium]